MHDLYLFYGATFFGAGVVLAFQARLPAGIVPRIALWLLAGFALVHAFAEWTEMEAVAPRGSHDRDVLRVTGLGLAVISYALLAQFAIVVLAACRRWPRWLIAPPILLAIAWVAIMIAVVFVNDHVDPVALRSFEAVSRHAFALPSALLTAWGLWALHRTCKHDRIGHYLAGASWAFVAYALTAGVIVGKAPFFPASYLNTEMFRAVVHLPIEAVRMVCAAIMVTCLSEAFVIQAARDRHELSRRREEFISIVAHDLRSPIGVIDLGADLLERQLAKVDGVNQEGMQKFLKRIKSSAHELERMVRDLLDTSRLETHMLALERRTVELRPLVSEIVERARELMHEHAVRVELPEDLPMVHADPMRVEQVLLNLLSNAAKYSTPATEITVEAKALPTEVELAVTNQGAGLTEWEISRVFSRFYRSKHARSVEGLGIGLYIAKGLVEAQGGRIWIESEPGRFATFRFTLPRIDAPPEVDDQVDQNLSPKPATG